MSKKVAVIVVPDTYDMKDFWYHADYVFDGVEDMSAFECDSVEFDKVVQQVKEVFEREPKTVGGKYGVIEDGQKIEVFGRLAFGDDNIDVMILHEAIKYLCGKEWKNPMRGGKGYDCDAIARVHKAIMKVCE